MNGFVQVSLEVEQALAEKATEVFEASGALSVTIVSADDQQCFDVATPVEPNWAYQRLSALFDSVQSIDSMVAKLSNLLNKKPDLVIENLEDQDWERSWLKNFRPLKVGLRLWVCPSWCEPVREHDINLIIDPGLAFGTGTHETTRLCLEYLASANLDGKKVIDFGCGSGILGIASIKLGAEYATGFDIDPRAVTASWENALLNDVPNKFRVMTTEEFFDHSDEKGDVVIANILAQTIIEFSDKIVSMVNHQGMLLLSGILESQVDTVIRAFPEYFNFSIQVMGDWALLIGKNITGNTMENNLDG